MNMHSISYDFNKDWKFNLGDVGDGASPKLDDSKWRILNLPHDWSVEFSFDKEKGEGCTGYLLGGIGWYRKHFITPSELNHSCVYLNFDGIYNNCEVYVNGVKIGEHPYGYSPFYYDITSYLNNPGEDNVIAVRVDRTRYADSRWYTGSGIYRKVKLIVVDKLHIPIWGTYITTPEINDEYASVNLDISVVNQYNETMNFKLKTTIFSPSGDKAATYEDICELEGNSRTTINQSFKINNPELWDIDSTKMYEAVTEIIWEDRVVQRYSTPFGIRFFKFDPNEGFSLNGNKIKIKGVCLHHDAGLVGAAVPIDVWRRRLEKLKKAGCNAIRTAHNPPSEEFLDLCDEMGFLVQVEFFDEWDYPKDKRLNQHERIVDYITRGYAEKFQEWAEIDLKNTMLRDRNHPCVFQWSIGNEIEWTYSGIKEATGYFDANANGNYFWTLPPYSREEIRRRYQQLPKQEHTIEETAAKLAKWTREMDKTRPVIANCILPSASYESGFADALDIVGYSYRQVIYDYGHKHYPDKPIMGTENVGQWHEWKHVIERDFVAGLFLWTGIDYMGEANEKWPKKGTASGLLDFAGFEKHSYHMMKTLWSEEPHVHLTTQVLENSIYKLNESGEVEERKPGGWKRRLWVWHDVNSHWNYDDSELIVVEVYSNCDSVELFLNGKSLGEKFLADFEDRIYKWAVPFVSGVLTAKGKRNGKVVAEDQLETADEPCQILLSVDKNTIEANCEDAVHVVAQLIDKNGVYVKTKEQKIQFNVEGKGCRVLGVDNGAIDNVQDYQSTSIVTSQGRALLILQSTDDYGVVKVSAESGDIKSKTIEIKVVPADI